MPYLTPAELRDALNGNAELAQVATPEPFAPIPAETMGKAIDEEDLTGDPNEEAAGLALERITVAIADAGNLVDNFLRGRYSLPLSVTPSTVKEIVVRVARYNLHDDHATDEIFRRYTEALGWLRDIRDGVMVLEVGPTDTVDTGLPAVSAGSGLYSVAGLGDYACPFGR